MDREEGMVYASTSIYVPEKMSMSIASDVYFEEYALFHDEGVVGFGSSESQYVNLNATDFGPGMFDFFGDGGVMIDSKVGVNQFGKLRINRRGGGLIADVEAFSCLEFIDC